MKDLNIPTEAFSNHMLRHAHVALLLHWGANIYEICDRMGHSSIRTTLETYGYLMDETKQQNTKLIVFSTYVEVILIQEQNIVLMFCILHVCGATKNRTNSTRLVLFFIYIKIFLRCIAHAIRRPDRIPNKFNINIFYFRHFFNCLSNTIN